MQIIPVSGLVDCRSKTPSIAGLTYFDCRSLHVAVDDRGAAHSIGKRTTGATAKEVREKLADLDRERLPTVERVREEQKREREQAQYSGP